MLTAFTVEAALGFGATLVSLALGSLFLPLPVLLPAIIPLNLALSSVIAARAHAQIDRVFLLRRLVPAMALGLPIGVATYMLVDPSLLKRLFGAFLAVVSVIELVRMQRMTPGATVPPLDRRFEVALLVLGGALHGAFATGGPMAVYVTSRVLHDKGVYRATLSTLWVVLNTVMLATYLTNGTLDRETLAVTGALFPSCASGLFLGEVAHHRVPVAAFRRGIFVMLALTGLMLCVRG